MVCSDLQNYNSILCQNLIISEISDDSKAFERTNKIYCGPGKGIFNGPKVILYDFIRSKTWDHLTHGGFVTYVHHDADGQLTWVTCRSGAKLWFLLIPKKDKEGKRKSIKDWYQLHDQLLQNSREIPDDFEVCSVLLEPGQVL